MLSTSVVTPCLPAVDAARAKKFYTKSLGLKFIKDDVSGGMLFEAGQGSKIYVYPRAATKADHTAASFSVEDIAAEVKALKAKGVKFEEYNTDQIKTVDSIATWGPVKAAWFKDSEGNILGLDQGM